MVARIGKVKDACCNTMCKGLLVSGGFSIVESDWGGRIFPAFGVAFICCLSCFDIDTRVHIARIEGFRKNGNVAKNENRRFFGESKPVLYELQEKS